MHLQCPSFALLMPADRAAYELQVALQSTRFMDIHAVLHRRRKRLEGRGCVCQHARLHPSGRERKKAYAGMESMQPRSTRKLNSWLCRTIENIPCALAVLIWIQRPLQHHSDVRSARFYWSQTCQ